MKELENFNDDVKNMKGKRRKRYIMKAIKDIEVLVNKEFFS